MTDTRGTTEPSPSAPATATGSHTGSEAAGPMFSVVSVVRNDRSGLEATRDSLFAQTFGEWEWIVVDGASTDGTADFAMSLAGPRIKVVSEKDRGIYDGMNKGVMLATGRYIILMNGGDLFAGSDVLARLAGELTAQPVDVLFGSAIMDFGLMKITRNVRPVGYIWHGQPGLHQSTVIDRHVHQRHLYSLDYKICGDYDLITRLFSAGCSMRTSPVLVSINEFDANSASNKRKLLLARECASIQRRNLKCSLPFVIASAGLRLTNSLVYKTLTAVQAKRRALFAPKATA